MFSDNDREEIEQEINEQTFTDDEEQLDTYEQTKMKSGFGKSFIKKFKNLQIRYKKDKRKTLVALAAILAMFSVVCGSSYAYLTYVSKTNNSVTISLGSLALIFQNEENAITLQNAVPVKDSVGLESDKEYSFKVKNTGTIPANYTITLDNICTLGSGVDTCIPDEYIKVGIKIGSGSYKVVERSEKSKYIIETGSLDAGAVQGYKMKVWLAHNTPNTYNSAISGDVYYKGKLGLNYEQGKPEEYEPEPGATVLYSDGTLIINEPSSQRQANITTHGAVSQEYAEMKSEGTDIQKYIFTAAADQPWASDRASITKVEIGQKVYPTSTKFWFYGLGNMVQGDFTNLDTSNVTTMNRMFQSTGTASSVTSFTLTGLDNWDTSKVTDMYYMFNRAGYNATTWNIGDISDWDTGVVEDMSGMFYRAAFAAPTFNLDLSGWNTSNVTIMQNMFNCSGYVATTWSIGDLSNWDTSKVTNMATMFNNAGSVATTWNSIGTLKIYATNIQQMFNACSKAKATLNIYSNPENTSTGYRNVFNGAATGTGALITVNYSSATTNIDGIVATGSGGNVVKGVQLD